MQYQQEAFQIVAAIPPPFFNIRFKKDAGKYAVQVSDTTMLPCKY
jgi:hypothetical protein